MGSDYPFIEPYNKAYLTVGGGHQLYYEEYGKPQGLPVLLCHGGPGGDINPLSICFFNPAKYRIIVFSQRGCGLSIGPAAQHNTSWLLVDDILALQNQLNIERAMLSGESWGATLAMLFAIHYPERVRGLLLRASFLADKAGFDWLYGPDGAGAHCYPEAYKDFAQGNGSADSVIEYYYQTMRRLSGGQLLTVAQRWLGWEQLLCSGEHVEFTLSAHQQQIQMANVSLHYMYHRCFIDEGVIFSHSDILSRLPVWFVHGRQDFVCPFDSVQRLASATGAHLDALDRVGHSVLDEVYCRAMRRAADLMYVRLARAQCKVLSSE